MKKQVIFIHGGDSFSDYNAFITHLKTCELRNVLEDPPQRWTNALREELGDAYEVFMPRMPNKDNAKYMEWKIWFQRYMEFAHDGVILVGHSLGGYFLVKYLTEEIVPVSVRALFLLAAPIKPDDFGREDGGDFNFDRDKLPLIAEKVEEIFIFHSKDDQVVPYIHGEEYAAAFPSAQFVSFEDKGHLLMESFPELTEAVKNVK